MWYGNGSNQDCKAMLRVVRLAERISGTALPIKIIKDSNHPDNRLFFLLPSGKRFRSMMAKTEKLRRSFFPQAPKLKLGQITSTWLLIKSLIKSKITILHHYCCVNLLHIPAYIIVIFYEAEYGGRGMQFMLLYFTDAERCNHELVYARTTPLTLSGKLPAIWERPLVVTLPNYRMLHTSLQLLLFIKSTVYCPAHFILLHILFFLIFFTFIYAYSLVLCYIFCTVHWADLTWFTFHYWLCSVYLSMWRIKPWILE